MKKRKYVFTCGLALCLLSGLSCAPKPVLLQGVVTFVTGNLEINNTAATVGSRVNKSDTLVTGDCSLAVVQIADTAVITLRSNTELKFENLANGRESQVVMQSLSRGSTFHRVMKKGTDYSVKTPVIVASVRGTSFEVCVTGTKSRVNLLEGKVRTEITTGVSEGVELMAGKYIEVDAGKAGLPGELDEADIDRLKKLDSITSVPDVEKVFPVKDGTGGAVNRNESIPLLPGIEVITEDVKESILNEEKSETCDEPRKADRNDKKEIKKVKKTKEVKKDTSAPSQENIRALIKKENRTIEDIKVVFKRIDEITLFNGKIIRGAITERGEMYSVITTDGVAKISEKEIQTVKVIR